MGAPDEGRGEPPMMPKSERPCSARPPAKRRQRRSSARSDGAKVCYADAPTQPRRPIVTRQILDDSRVHPAIRARIADEGREVIAEVEAAAAANAVVVVGMAWNPFPGKARKWLDAAGVPYKYLEFGSYVSQWRKRLPLKLWTGWTTFPMVFVNGEFIGGATDLMRMNQPTLKQSVAAWSP